MNDSFFGKNGMIQDLMKFSNVYRGMQSTSSQDRLGALGKLVSTVMALFA